MKNFSSKKQIFEYLKNKFMKEDVTGIIIQGSTAFGKIKEFSDIDCVIFNKTKLKPYYELGTLNNNLFLISVYFYKPGKKKPLPKNAISLFGNFYEEKEHKNNLVYTKEEKEKRNNQMLVDLLFKYIRHKDKSLIKSIEKYTNI